MTRVVWTRLFTLGSAGRGVAPTTNGPGGSPTSSSSTTFEGSPRRRAERRHVEQSTITPVLLRLPGTGVVTGTLTGELQGRKRGRTRGGAEVGKGRVAGLATGGDGYRERDGERVGTTGGTGSETLGQCVYWWSSSYNFESRSSDFVWYLVSATRSPTRPPPGHPLPVVLGRRTHTPRPPISVPWLRTPPYWTRPPNQPRYPPPVVSETGVVNS